MTHHSLRGRRGTSGVLGTHRRSFTRQAVLDLSASMVPTARVMSMQDPSNWNRVHVRR